MLPLCGTGMWRKVFDDMNVVVVTGSGGLVGSRAVRHFVKSSDLVVGIDDDSRARFFGPEASTAWSTDELAREFDQYHHVGIDIRNGDRIHTLFAEYGSDIRLIVHTAAQPSHDWAARDPKTDFTVNANGTLELLEATRRWCPEAVFVFTSTNKVYGDRPNHLPLVELATRWELEDGHPWAEHGIDETMSVDATLHSLFGVSKLAADVLVQEYGRYFGMRTAVLRGGCLTGPAHSGTELHGFLAYLMKCTVLGTPYRVFGYKGKQVRDNVDADDVVAAFDAIYRDPRPGEVYNIGGGRFSNCSMLEAITACEEIACRPLQWTYEATPRIGDHTWWISSTRKLEQHFGWRPTRSIIDILREIHEVGVQRWRNVS